MANDWMTFRLSLPRSRKVLTIAARLSISPAEALGRVCTVWAWAHEQTTDGKLDGVTPREIDAVAGLTGFADAMLAVEWLEVGDGWVTLPRWDTYNSRNAKIRAKAAQRMAVVRCAPVRKMLRDDANKSATTEQNRTEENKTAANARACNKPEPEIAAAAEVQSSGGEPMTEVRRTLLSYGLTPGGPLDAIEASGLSVADIRSVGDSWRRTHGKGTGVLIRMLEARIALEGDKARRSQMAQVGRAWIAAAPIDDLKQAVREYADEKRIRITTAQAATAAAQSEPFAVWCGERQAQGATP